MRPTQYIDTVFDFGVANTNTLTLTADSSYFQNNSAVGTQALQNFISTGVGNPSKLLNANGDFVPPATSPVVVTDPILGGTTNMTVLFTNFGGIPFNVKITQPGLYENTIILWQSGAYWTQMYPGSPGEILAYKIFQKSVAVIEDQTTNPVIVNGQTKSMSINDIVKLNKGKSRGNELGSTWLIQVRDSNGNFVTAVQNTDYQIISGNFNTDIIEFKVLQAKLFKVVNTVQGYVSNNNSYPGTGTGDVTVNTDSTFYLLDVGQIVNNNQDIITIPKINSVVTIQNQISTIPVQQGYSGALVSVTSFIDISTGSYAIKNISSGVITIVTMNTAQWIEEINTRCNVTLEIRNKSNGNIIINKTGLGPHTNITLPVGTFQVQFKTVLK